jgi:hypothetical protein
LVDASGSRASWDDGDDADEINNDDVGLEGRSLIAER